MLNVNDVNENENENEDLHATINKGNKSSEPPLGLACFHIPQLIPHR